MPQLSLLMQAAIDGLSMGAIYAVVAVGLTMVFGVMKIVNFAHGDFLMIGMYVCLLLARNYGVDPYVGIPLSMLVMAGAAVLFYKLLIEPILEDAEHNQIVVTLGASMILQNAALALFSADFQTIPSILGHSRFGVLGLTVRTPVAIGCVVAILACTALYLFLRWTDTGRMVRATADDRQAAALSGVSVKRIYTIAFCIGAGSLGLVAPLVAPFLYAAPQVGNAFTLNSFIIVVLGGLGSFGGALIGGLFIGVIEGVGNILSDGAMPALMTYAAFVTALLLRPQGLFGRASR